MFNTSLLDDAPERPSNLLTQVKKGDQVIVCQQDSIVCGHYRGDGAFWYSLGTVLKISRKDRYALVRYMNRYGNDAQQRFAPDGYPLDETGVAVERDRLGWYGGIVLLLSPRLSERLRHQELVDQTVRRDWKDWERLDDSTLEALCRALEARREEHISNVLTAGRSSLCLLAAKIGSGCHSWKVWLEDRPLV